MMKRNFGLTAIVAVAATFAASAQTLAAGALDLVPADSTVVVRFKNPESTITKVAGFANQVQPGIGFLIQGQAQALGVIISNPTMGGVDLKDDWYISVKVNKGDLPHVTFYVPATNVDAMTESIGEDFSFAMKGKWVAYSEAEEATQAVKQCIAGKRKSISTVMDRRSTELFNGNEISAFINIKNLSTTFSDEIAGADEQLDAALEQFSALIPETPGMNIGAIFNMYGGMGHGLIQGVRDSEAFTLGVGISEDALTFEELLVVTPDTKTATALSKHTTSEMNLLKKLPQDRVGYFAAHGNMQSVMEFGMKFAGDIFGDNKEAKGKMDKAAEIMKDVKLGQIVATFKLNENVEDGIFTAIALTEATPAAKMKELTRNMAFDAKLPGMKQTITVKKDAEKYGDLSADVVTTKQEFDAELDPLGTQQEIIDLIHGPNGLVQRVITTKDTVIQTTGGDQATMKAALAAFQSPAGTGNEALNEARGMVLKKANFVAFVDLQNLVMNALRTAVATGKVPIPIPVNQLPEIAPSYMSFSVGTEENGLRMKSAVPAKSLAGFAKLAAVFGGGGGGF
jgi:hypothetical protein